MGSVIPSGISTMPCHGANSGRREDSRYRHLERPHGSLAHAKKVSNVSYCNLIEPVLLKIEFFDNFFQNIKLFAQCHY